MSKTVVCFGAGPAYKGGMSNYNTSLAKAFNEKEDVKVHIVSWSQQYPAIVPREFKDRVSSHDFLEGTDISVDYITNYNNPISYAQTARFIAKFNPDVVVIQWSIAIQGLPIGRIVRKLKKICKCEVILDLHFVIQKEQSAIDKGLTKYGISKADTYIVHALKTYEELQQLFPDKEFVLSHSGERTAAKGKPQPVIKLFHPIYDLYQPDPEFDKEEFKRKLDIPGQSYVFLFFGFIRKYKGLHDAIEAFHLVARNRPNASFVICGELFWNTLPKQSIVGKIKKAVFKFAKTILLNKADNEGQYNPLPMIKELDLEERTAVVSEYVPNEDVHKYFQIADSVVLFYETATPSGIESLSYNFDLPILATRVGHFPETIEDGVNGYLAKPKNIESMAAAMLSAIDKPIPRTNVAEYKKNLSWQVYVDAILNGV